MAGLESNPSLAEPWFKGLGKFAGFIIGSTLFAQVLFSLLWPIYILVDGADSSGTLGDFSLGLALLQNVATLFAFAFVVSIPIAITGFVLGYPVWRKLVPILERQGLPHDLVLAMAAVVVAIIAAFGFPAVILMIWGVRSVVADIMPAFAIFGQLLVFGLAGAIFVSRIVHDGAQRDGSSLAVQSGRMFWPVFERMFLTIWLIVSAVVVLGCLTVPAFLLVALVGILLSAPATVTLAAVAVIPCRMVWGMVSGAVERAGNGARAAICWAGLAMGVVAGSILAAAVLWFSSKYPTLSGKFGLIGLVPVSIAGLAGWRAADRQSRMQEQGAW